jgi:hypothetical protein
LRRIFVGGVISTFEYWSEFNLRVETDAALRQGSPIPPAFNLRLRANWWMGQKTEWDLRLVQFPIRARRTQNAADPLRASLIMSSLGSTIVNLAIAEDGTLLLTTSDGDTITVPARDTQWEESWMLELPPDHPQKDDWIVFCDDGDIFGRIPQFFHSLTGT